MDRKIRLKLFLEIASLLFIILIFVIVNLCIRNNRIKKVQFCADNNNYSYQIEKVVESEDSYTISGWFIWLQNVNNVSMQHEVTQIGLVLQPQLEDTNSLESVGNVIPVQVVNRDDVNEYFECGIDYSQSGFIATVNKSKFTRNVVYRVGIKPDIYKENTIRTNYYFINGQLTMWNASGYQDYFIDTDLEKIVTDGYLLVYRPDVGMMIIEYDKKMYWIASEEYSFDENGNTYLEYSFGTTQYINLPDERKKRGTYWGNLSGSFEQYEITDTIDCGSYRVSVRDIPSNLSITYFNLGLYRNGESIWNEICRPNYQFVK